MTDSPKWARGYPLDFLKRLAVIFRDEFKPHTYGAFGLPKERDIADARADGSLIWTRDMDAVAIAKVLARPSKHKDFADREATIQGGDLFVKAIAGTPEGKGRLIEALAARSGAPAIWIEAHVESDAAVAALMVHGFRHVMTKISASSDLKGLFLRGAFAGRLPKPLDPSDEPAVSIMRRDWISSNQRLAILDEATRFAEWAQHYSSYNKRSSWTAFALCGFDRDNPTFIIKPAEMSKGWKEQNPEALKAPCGPTIAADRFPVAMAVADSVPGKKERVRLMRLSAKHGELTRHADITDPDAGTRDGQLMRVHIPIQTAPACQFRAWGLDGRERRLHFPERSLCYIDTRKPHAVVNPAAVDRVHLVMDVWATDALRRLLVQ